MIKKQEGRPDTATFPTNQQHCIVPEYQYSNSVPLPCQTVYHIAGEAVP